MDCPSICSISIISTTLALGTQLEKKTLTPDGCEMTKQKENFWLAEPSLIKWNSSSIEHNELPVACNDENDKKIGNEKLVSEKM